MKEFLLCFSMLCLCVFHGSAQIEKITWSRDGFLQGLHIYTMFADGTNATRLTRDGFQIDLSPRFSPDGSKIVFQRYELDIRTYDIYVMNADGTNLTNLTANTNLSNEVSPDWSPDGNKIIFSSNQLSPFSQIFMIDADGGNQVRLTTNTNFNNGSPCWSSTNKIAFSSSRDGDLEIYTMDPDGSNQQRLTNGPAGYTNDLPRWSLDGSKIVFNSYTSGDYGVSIMNADGSGQSRLVSAARAGAWSPDGTRIIYVSEVGTGKSTDINIINIDGTNSTRISPVDPPPAPGGTPFTYDDSDPHWIAIAIPPVALAGTTPAVTATTALVNGIVSANGAATAVFFQYSNDPAMVSGVTEIAATPDSLGPFNNNNVPASASLVNLAPGTTYYYRLKGVNSKGTALGPIQSFNTTTAIPLPVLFVSYEAQLLTNNQAKLTWRTAQESNNSHFVIEKSTDGILFTAIDRVESKGNSTTISDYTFTDPSFTTATAYYRLKQVDRDGRSTESGIRKVSRNGSQNNARLYPNPVTNNLFTVETGGTLPVKYNIVNVTGQQVQEGLLKTPKEQVDISAIPKGHYMLRLSDGNTIKFRKD